MFAYLRGRPSLLRVCLLIDARHGIKKADEEVLELLGKAAVPFQIVLTKSDLVRRGELQALQLELETRLAKTIGAMPHLIATSSRSQDGIELLRAALAKLRASRQDPSAAMTDPAIEPAIHAVASTLIEALPFMRRYQGAAMVIKYGGHAMGDDDRRAQTSPRTSCCSSRSASIRSWSTAAGRRSSRCWIG